MKRELRIGIWAMEKPPMLMVHKDGVIRGLLPELSQFMTHSLGLTVQFIWYNDHDAALRAVQRGDIDAMLDRGAAQPESGPQLTFTEPLFVSHPVVVKSSIRAFQPDVTPPVIAVPKNFVTSTRLRQHFRLAQTVAYPDTLAALASVANGKSHLAVGDMITSNYLIEHHFANSLTIENTLDLPASSWYLALRNDQGVLRQIINEVMRQMSPTTRELLLRRWDQGAMNQFLTSALPLTNEENDWLAQHHSVKIIVTQFNAPFMLFDNQHNFYGITADVLKLIHLKTGLQFIPVSEDDVTNIPERLAEPDISMVGSILASPERARQLLLTNPFMFSPNVLVMSEMNHAEPWYAKMRVALPAGHAAAAWLKVHHPDVQVIPVSNSAVAMQMVAEGKADGAVNTLISADYVIARYYVGQLRVAELLPMPQAEVSLGVKRSEPELYGIINKALDAIPPKMYSEIIARWQGTPEAQFRTWSVYRTQFYLVAIAALLLVATFFLWGLIMRRRVKHKQLDEQRLQAELSFRDRLINGPPRPVYVINRDGIIIHYNQAFHDFFGDAQQTLLTLPLYDRRNPLGEIYQSIINRIADNQPWTETVQEQEFVLDSKRGERRITHWLTPYSESLESPTGWICGWQDVTDYLLLLDNLSKARETADLANRSKSQFLATMSHEIRTPLSAIIGLLELSVHQPESSDPRMLRTAYDSAHSLMGLIGDILDMSKIESGKLVLNPEWSTIEAVVKPVIRVFDGLARQKTLTLNLHLEQPVPSELYIDPLRLRQVVANFVSNAVKFTHQGRIDVVVSLVPDNEGHARLSISVQDTGVGIDPSSQKRVFQPFEQAGADDAAGTGLGLSITSELIKMMAGQLTLESMPGAGTQIGVELNVDYRPVAAVSEASILEETHLNKRLQVLIVDDHPANRLLLGKQLALLGHQVVEAEDGLQGWQCWQQGAFDLIITDCNMPVMDGLTLTRRVRASQHSAVKIIGMTANAQESERQRCLDAGMDICLFRPLELGRLEQELVKLWPDEHDMQLKDWMDPNVMDAFLPDDSVSRAAFLSQAVVEARLDLMQSQQRLAAGDCEGLARHLHRISGTFQVLKVNKILDEIVFLEELVSENEEEGILQTRLEELAANLEKFDEAIKKSQC
ncbi:transporter substrate-binding domain-containing protein [Pantoea sp. EA-12]|uniref:response regulator n=1 Tax=Pantoea sp. EA-12 TaxID=3043303 RepID=UPI0024B609CC|nr:transporter substrate-binding domain-containing protein [Pantoea sp. EA-12]MDI9222449.1 transporter substrate-binding domain-containing protein [Pantoea sp. EA-12]